MPETVVHVVDVANFHCRLNVFTPETFFQPSVAELLVILEAANPVGASQPVAEEPIPTAKNAFFTWIKHTGNLVRL